MSNTTTTIQGIETMKKTSHHNPENLGSHIQTFAVISDSHVNADEDKCNSPFLANQRSNPRFRYVIHELNQQPIDFAIHLGDLVHPVPDTGDAYSNAAKAYGNIVKDLNVPIHVIPGNHDIGDTPLKGAPASPTTNAMIDAWKHEFGEQYSSFESKGVLYILLNAQLINSGLPSETEQKQWLLDLLKANKGKRMMMMLHHPIYLENPEELDHYDNTNEPGRSWLLGLFDEYNIEAVFSGHAHNYWYNRYNQTDSYSAASNCAVRHDYSEMGRAVPPDGKESGRNDVAKLGYFIVTVYEHGHVVKFIRTYGQEIAPNGIITHDHPPLLAATPRESFHNTIGFDVRKNWAEITEVAPMGCVDEFERKVVRNDYHLLALQEMGTHHIRIPIQDLLDPKRRERLSLLQHIGITTTLFCFGIPASKYLDLIRDCNPYITSWEVAVEEPDLADMITDIKKAQSHTGVPIHITRMRTNDDHQSAEQYHHTINHGYLTTDDEKLQYLADNGITGAVFRLGANDDVFDTITQADKVVAKHNMTASIHVRVSLDNPAARLEDDNWTVNRVAEAILASKTCTNVRLFCNTLVDIDRGYFVRNGAIDNCGNPRPLLHAVKSLSHIFNQSSADIENIKRTEQNNGIVIHWQSDGINHALFLPNHDGEYTIADTNIPHHNAQIISLTQARYVKAGDKLSGAIVIKG